MFFIVRKLVNNQMLPGVPQWPGFNNKKLNGAARLFVASIVFDAFISITALALGISGIIGVLPSMPPAASYTLTALGGLIALTWLVEGATQQGRPFKLAASWLRVALSSDP